MPELRPGVDPSTFSGWIDRSLKKLSNQTAASDTPCKRARGGANDDRLFVAQRELRNIATLRHFNLKKPLIVAANGHAIAGGFEMLLSGDIRVIATTAKLGLPEVALGLIPAMGGTARLAKHMPPSLAAEMLLTGRPISAATAQTAGFANYIVEPKDVLPRAMEIAKVIAVNAPLAVSAALTVYKASWDVDEASALQLEAEQATRLSHTEDAIEGPRSFFEKHPPVFKGR